MYFNQLTWFMQLRCNMLRSGTRPLLCDAFPADAVVVFLLAVFLSFLFSFFFFLFMERLAPVSRNEVSLPLPFYGLSGMPKQEQVPLCLLISGN